MNEETFIKLKEKFYILKDEFNRLKLDQVFNQNPTFFEITNQVHLENVSSRILEFYFNTDNPHQLNDLFLKALLRCIKKESNYKRLRTIHTELEVSTDNGNRIDLWLETDQFLIIIENKINHILNNPLKDYIQYAEKNKEDK